MVGVAAGWSSGLRFTYCSSSLLGNALGKILYTIQLACVVSVGPSQSAHRFSVCLEIKEEWVADERSINLNAFSKKLTSSPK